VNAAAFLPSRKHRQERGVIRKGRDGASQHLPTQRSRSGIPGRENVSDPGFKLVCEFYVPVVGESDDLKIHCAHSVIDTKIEERK
jgi:hypothetical protein